MAELLKLQTLSFFLLFVAPGFVAMQVYDLLVPSERRNFANATVELISFSLLNYVLLVSPLEQHLTGPLRDTNPTCWRLLLLLVVVVAPAAEAIAFRLLRGWRRLRRFLLRATPTGWDHFFSQGRRCWVLCSLKSGKRIGGWYGRDSLASSYPRPAQVYLEEVWTVDATGRFLSKIPNTAGAVVSMADCELIEMFWDNEVTNG